jgi:DNA polymerase
MGKKESRSGGSPVRAMIQKLESLAQAGVTHLPKPPRTRGTQAVERAPQAASEAADPGGQADPRQAALAKLQARVAVCTRCKELARTRTQTVFGVGNPHARLVFIGEAPGADEDREGEPFVGAAGQLLNKILQACTLRREDVYICNILRCRPPGNRTPSPEEAANCREYLDRQLAIIQPEYICCLGAVAAQNLLGTTRSIGQLRGQLHDYRGMKVLCTYHPAYLLRTPSAKRQVWEDMQLLMAAMGIEIPKR